MDITKRSTSPLMVYLFGEDLKMILRAYNNCIEKLAQQHPYLEDVFSDCINRTGFIFPYMSVEYGYYSIKKSFLPKNLKNLVMGFGLIGLAVSVDDDIVDEYSGNHLKMVSNISVSQLIQNFAYDLIFSYHEREKSEIVMSEINRALYYVARYQYMDALNIVRFKKKGFDIMQYLQAARKTVCPCLLYTSPSPRDLSTSRMPSSA